MRAYILQLNLELDCLVIREKIRVAQGFVDVFGFKEGIIPQDPLACFTGSQEAKQTRHREPQAPYAWLTRTDSGVNRYACQSHCDRIPKESERYQHRS